MFSYKSTAQERISTADYINQWSATAVTNMEKSGIPASIILAQGLLESGAGNSELARDGNNHFGIKCHGWTGDKIYHDDDKKGECFRKYPSAQESFNDHVAFLSGSKRYAFLFELKPTDYKAWAKGLKEAGYATNPKYPKLLIDIIEKNNLQDYDSNKGRKQVAKIEDKPKDEDKFTQNKKPKESAEKEEKSRKQLRAEKRAAKKSAKAKENSLPNETAYPVSVSSNNIQYINAIGGERLRELADALLLNVWQLEKYNDLVEFYKFEAGERVYIQPKRRKAQVESVTVKEESAMRELSQAFGIKIKHIIRYNPSLTENSVLNKGDVVYLQKH